MSVPALLRAAGTGAVLAALVVTSLPRSVAGQAVIDDAVTRRLSEALSLVNLSIADLYWQRRPVDDEFRLPAVDQALDQPLRLAEQALRIEREFAADPFAAAVAATRWLDVAAPAELVVAAPDPRSAFYFPGAGDGARPLLLALFRGYRQARADFEDAMGTLDAGERALLAERGDCLYLDRSDEDPEPSALLAAASKIDIAALVRAELRLAALAAEIRKLARDVDPTTWKTQRWRVEGLLVALGGPGSDRHDADIVLDGGGDDLYEGGRVIADLAGDDSYRDAARGLLAVALILDIAGDDRYLGGDVVAGGAAFGASLLVDDGGDDRYDADQCAQGAAFFGIGMLFDRGGSDSYRGARFVQGFGGTRGLGVLSDLEGNDSYYAGGTYRHAPLLPENFQSLSQGFGFGLRGAKASGGVGILADHGGNDIYSAEVFGQGASYWFALGALVDSAGHDSYNLFQYGQGAGIHLSPGVLFDRAGNDAYSCLNGVAQGSGHDWGVGLLLDGAGNDGYQGSGMSQGGANANAVGLLIDRAGNDSYAGWNVKNQGDAFLSRGTIGLGVLLDLDGEDRYTHGGHDGAAWTRGTVGVGLDVAEPRAGATP